MINKIIDFSINNKFIIGLFTLGLIITGIWSTAQIPLDAVPDITNNQVQVITQSPNLGTEDIEQFVTYPIEVAMSNLPDVQEIRSISRFGLSVVTIVFDDKTGTYLPRQLVAEKLPEVQAKIPLGFGKPFMGPISTGLGEIYQYTLEVDDEYKEIYTKTQLRSIQDWIVRRQMAMVPGVVEINAFGGAIKQYEVAVDPNDLRAIGITISEVFATLENNNQNTGGAYIERNHQANFIRGEGLARSVKDIENMVVKTMNGIPVKIKDVGTVSIGNAIRYGALTKDGKGEAVGGMVLMLKGANANEVIKNVTIRIKQIQKSLPKGITIQPFLDRSTLIQKTTGTVMGNLLEGGLIVIFVLVLLLGNWRGGLIVASTIPLSLLFAFILMNFFDVWANLMSLGAIDFGIIVDGAVIIVEATVFSMHRYVVKKKVLSGKIKNEIVQKASKKMMNTAFFGQLIILIVFLPILALEGVEGKMFQPMALTFIFAMIGAMVLCLTYVPMISSVFLKVPANEKKSFGDQFVNWVEQKYESLLIWSLEKGRIIVIVTLGFFVLAIVTFINMGGEFIPELDEGDIAFHAMLKPGSSLSETIQTTTRVEGIIKTKFPEVQSVISRIGVADVPTDPMPMDIADVFVILKPANEWVSADSKDELIEKIKKEVSILPGVNFEFTQPIEMRFNELLTGVREDVAIKLFGEDLQVLTAKAEEIGEIIAKIPGVADMKVEATDGLPQITINYNRNKVAQYGLSIRELNTLIQVAFAGGQAGVIFEGEKRFDLVVRLQKENREDLSDIQNLFIDLPNGAQIPLREVAAIGYEPGPMQISRDNTNRRTYVGINIRGRDVKSVVEDIQDSLDKNFELPSGYYLRYGGAFENLKRASNRLKLVVPIALFLIFVLIYFALKSFSQSLMIYLAIPMATIGGVFALWFREMPFSISAGVGFIVLFGVAVLNGLVMVSGLNELKEEGITDLRDRIIKGTKRRIRPIMLTAFTDVLGFLPMAVSTSAGGEVQRPLATVVIGGLITSTLLTLFILPIFYQWIENRSQKNIKLNPKYVVTPLIVFLLCTFSKVAAQETFPSQYENKTTSKNAITEEQDVMPVVLLDEAVELALKNYPTLESDQLQVEREDVLMSAAYDFGNTKVFTGGEEIGNDQGIYTVIGIGQQNIDLFGISAKKRLQKQRIDIAKNTYELSQLEVKEKVRSSWSDAYRNKQKMILYQELTIVYSEFLRAIEVNLEVEAISRLEFITAKNQALQVQNKLHQLEKDYYVAIQELNIWLSSDTFYTVPDDVDSDQFLQLDTQRDASEHPQLSLLQKQIDESTSNYKVILADQLPKFNLQGGLQRVNGENGFYSYQAGISVPLLSGTYKSQKKAAKINNQIAKIQFNLRIKQMESNYQRALHTYQKWLKSWLFYKNDVLPLTKEQRDGALLAYKEGAIDYLSFTYIINKAIQSETEAIDAFDKYLKAFFKLQYYYTL